MEDYQAELMKLVLTDSEVVFKIPKRSSSRIHIIYDEFHYINTMMKIVKINKRYKLYHKGYTHALRWDRYSSIVKPYEQALEQLYGKEIMFDDQSPWKHVYLNYSSESPYFIYVKSKSMLTMLLLKVKS